MLRIAVDAAPLLGHATGVGVFTRGLFDALGAVENARVSAYALSGRGSGKLAALLPPGVKASARPMPAKLLIEAWKRWEHPKAEFWTGTADVVHGTNFVVPPTRSAGAVVTVHDLTAIRYPEMCTPTTLAYPKLIERAIARGAHVHVLSQAICREVREFFDVDAARVHIVQPGPPAVAKAEAPGGRPYFLAIGTIEPRKNYLLLVRAFDEVARVHADVDLVIVGTRGWGAATLDEAIDESAFGTRIKQLGWVDDSLRAGLLRGALALVYPSIYEGFGLPPLEAMIAGVPVVATANEAVVEVTDGAALLSPPGDSGALAECMLQVVDDEAERARLIAVGTARVAQLSWQRAASEMMVMYSQVASAR